MRKRVKFLSSSNLQPSLYNHHDSKLLSLQTEEMEEPVFQLTTSTCNSNLQTEQGQNFSAKSTLSGFRFGLLFSDKQSESSENIMQRSFFKSGEKLRSLIPERDENGLPSLSKLRESHEKLRLSQKIRPRKQQQDSFSLNTLKDCRANETCRTKSPVNQSYVNEMRSTEKFLNHLEGLDPAIGLKPRKNIQARQSLIKLLGQTGEKEDWRLPRDQILLRLNDQSEDKSKLSDGRQDKKELRKVLSVFIPRKTNTDFQDFEKTNKKKQSISPVTPFSSFKRSVVKKLDIKRVNNEFWGKHRLCTPSSRRERFSQNPLLMTNEICKSMDNLTKFKDGKWLYHFLEKEIKFIENFDKEKYGKPEEIAHRMSLNLNSLKNMKGHSNSIKNMIIDVLEKRVKEVDPISLLYQLRNKKATMSNIDIKGKSPTSKLRVQESLGAVNPIKFRKLFQLSRKLEEANIENENEYFHHLKEGILKNRKLILDTELEMLNKYKKNQEWELVDEMKKKYKSDLNNRINSYESDLRHRVKKCETTVGELKFVSDRNKMALVNLDYMVSSLKNAQANFDECSENDLGEK